MKFTDVREDLKRRPLFRSDSLRGDNASRFQVQRRLSDWIKAGKVTPLRRGLYVLSADERELNPHPFLIANHLVEPSYVSLETALSYYGLIPEQVGLITNVTTGRPGRWSNEFGRYSFRHLKESYFFGMWQYEFKVQPGKRLLPLDNPISSRSTERLSDDAKVTVQSAAIAVPEKALLDLLYLRPGGDSPRLIRSLRLQNLDLLDLERLEQFAERFDKPKVTRCVETIMQLQQEEASEFHPL